MGEYLASETIWDTVIPSMDKNSPMAFGRRRWLG